MESEFKMLDTETEYKDSALSLFPSVFKANDFMRVARDVFRDNGLNALCEALKSQGKGQIPLHRELYNWFGDGVRCEILSPGAKGWQKGKVRIKIALEFRPDEPEISEIPESNEIENGPSKSPLDDVRQIVRDT